jgi:hypothetical protein
MVPWLVPVITAIVAAVGGYFLREFDKRKEREAEEYRRKEEHYAKLILCLRGLIVRSQDTKLREDFLNELNLAWLYCPDDIINKINGLMDVIPADGSLEGESHFEGEINTAFGELFLAIRKDLISRKLIKKTKLKGSDFKLYKDKAN